MSDTAGGPQGAGQRRYLTLLFCDLADSTLLGRTMEAEHYADMLGEIRAACRDVLPRYGGTIVRIQGDGVLAIFGYPEAADDDARRATEAALELHQRVAALRFDPPLPGGGSLALHSGIHAGLVLLGEGDLMRGRFDLTGDAPHIASLLSDIAARGEVIASDDALASQRAHFETDAPHALALAGRSVPITVYCVRGRSGQPSTSAPPHPASP